MTKPHEAHEVRSLVDASLAQPGPTNGNGPGESWNGLVERTPAIWIRWLKELCQATGRDIEDLGFQMYGIPVKITGVELTFGTRHYFICPGCARRCEALFFVGEPFCRECANLGYLSQSHRPSSALGELRRIRSRRLAPGMHLSNNPNPEDKEMLLKLFQEALKGHYLRQVELIAEAIELDAQ